VYLYELTTDRIVLTGGLRRMMRKSTSAADWRDAAESFAGRRKYARKRRSPVRSTEVEWYDDNS